ncbi:MAG: helix-turn-helix transcriptional regulator [Thermoanaerobaculia bacterium]
MSEKTLSKWRLEGRGPKFRRRGHPTRGRVVYLREDVLAWLQGLPAATTTTEERVRVERTAA